MLQNNIQTFKLKKQFFKLFGGIVRIYNQQDQLVAYIDQKAFKLKEDIQIFTDESKSQLLMVIRARSILDFRAVYDVWLANGQKVGALKRDFISSLFRDKWTILDANDNPIGEITEDMPILALARRFLSSLIPQGYDGIVMNQKIFELNQKFNPFVYHADVVVYNPNSPYNFYISLACCTLLSLIEGRQD